MEDDLLSALPEDLVQRVISFTSPRDACRMATMSSAIRSAADSDTVWGRFLPSDYKSLVERVVDSSSVHHASLKELYFRLCDGHVLIDGGSLSFGLDRPSGKKCYMISARSLSIIWSDHPLYWKWISMPESRFTDAAELVAVCWLHIQGKMDLRLLSQGTRYAAYLIFMSTGLSDGFEDLLVEVEVGVDGGEYDKGSVYLDTERERRGGRIPREEECKLPKMRKDGWMEVKIGEFFSGEGQGEVEMRVKEVQRLNWKSGIVVLGMEIRPTEDVIIH